MRERPHGVERTEMGADARGEGGVYVGKGGGENYGLDRPIEEALIVGVFLPFTSA